MGPSCTAGSPNDTGVQTPPAEVLPNAHHPSSRGRPWLLGPAPRDISFLASPSAVQARALPPILCRFPLLYAPLSCSRHPLVGAFVLGRPENEAGGFSVLTQFQTHFCFTCKEQGAGDLIHHQYAAMCYTAGGGAGSGPQAAHSGTHTSNLIHSASMKPCFPPSFSRSLLLPTLWPRLWPPILQSGPSSSFI